ncbi:DUF2252 domain-containing protein [Mycobacteroides chelonae]|jgi:uncharacterized protein (DUF2252 family)|uniref:DUF2252 domain-containing protein n=1 Tax=Mycobacteroides chelonae TaxID=1774 RepID=UPI0008A94BCB|nr:DUF2252 domain-containing protein [Mycobacteroides chelonae]MBF9350715.1 DUF2252 domain-containing protein [Mycobacteroides chelonae]MEC4838767.1 DUF2252 domain-containing protein [Mycobacteroides chelonae]MEC4845132.1 DUF2252 domain-containing protein [Mycobacteroides chelonae]OHU34759.1 hypothetical protein BKG80_17725 [Mycobacteroides chelonae]OHU53361.1 hypothetical protein BKG81_06025 [Mycobacteroides chelonae]
MDALTPVDLRRLPRDKQLALGRGLRDQMPRRRLAELPDQPHRDPIAVLAAQNTSRIPSLVPVRRERMSESPFAFYRGAAAVMASDLAGTATTGVPIQICGDAHLSNFGLFASRERALLFDVNDFDETAIGPWEWDVKRLVTSVAILGQEFGMSDDAVRASATKTAAAYRTRMRELAQLSALERFYLKTTALEVLDLVSRLSKSASKLATETVSKASRNTSHRALKKLTATTVDGRYRIVEQQDIAVRVPEVGFSEAAAMVEEYFGSVPEDVVALLACHQFEDAVVRVVGVGSVGTRCYLALLTDADGSPLFLQMKEASASVIEPYFPQELRLDHGRRVVAGQRIMQASGDPFLGYVSSTRRGSFYVRQFRDMKGSVEIASLTDPNDLALYGSLCAMALARAHAQSGVPGVIAGYLGAGADPNTADAAFADFADAYVRVNRADHQRLLDASAEQWLPSS